LHKRLVIRTLPLHVKEERERYILVKVGLDNTPAVFLTYDSFVFFATDHVLFIVSSPVCHGAEDWAMKAGK
jgi:hypothetical protein